MSLSEDSTYYQRLEYAESARLKLEYGNLGYKVYEQYSIPTSTQKKVVCDLFIESPETGEKIVFEIKAKGNNGIDGRAMDSVIQKRKEIAELLPGVKFYLRIVEQHIRTQNNFYGIEKLLTYLFKFRHDNGLREKIRNDFKLNSFSYVAINSINIGERKIKIEGVADAEVIFKINQQNANEEVRDIIPISFKIQITDYHYVWEMPMFRHMFDELDRPNTWVDRHVKSEFGFELEEY